VGPPGTGKTTLVEKVIADAVESPEAFGLEQPPEAAVHGAEADWTARSLVGGHYPTAEGKLVFREGAFLDAVRLNKWLVIDEMNRADLDRSMGPLFTLLSGHRADLGLTELTDTGKRMIVRWTAERHCSVVETAEFREYRVGADWRLIGTYNSVDLGRVFSMGAALSRRWATIPVPAPAKDKMASIVKGAIPTIGDDLAEAIGKIYQLQAEILPLGPAPYLDIAKYVLVATSQLDEQQRASQLQMLIGDGYVLYIKPQFRRLAPDTRTDLITSLAGILGGDVATELGLD
jgi:MoxR-like ATPase